MRAGPPSPSPCHPSPNDADTRPPEVRRTGSANASSIWIEGDRVAEHEQMNLAGRIANFIRFPFNGFTYFLNLKVLFNFPSPYLLTIGLVPVFSFRWSLPPVLGCIPKQPDSSKAHHDSTLRKQPEHNPTLRKQRRYERLAATSQLFVFAHGQFCILLSLASIEPWHYLMIFLFIETWSYMSYIV